MTQQPCGVAAKDGIGRHVARDDCIGGDDRAVADVYTGQHRHVLTEPDVIPHDRIALERKLVKRGRAALPIHG